MTETTPQTLGPTPVSTAAPPVAPAVPATTAGTPVPAVPTWPPTSSTYVEATATPTDPAPVDPAPVEPAPVEPVAVEPVAPTATVAPVTTTTTTGPEPTSAIDTPAPTTPASTQVKPRSSPRGKLIVLVAIGLGVLLLLAAAAFVYLKYIRSDDPPPVVSGALPTSQPLTASQLVVSSLVDGNRDLYLDDAATGATVGRLTSSPTADTSPVISPDRRTLIYIHHTSDAAATDEPTLRVAGAQDGSGDRALFPTTPDVCTRNIARPAWNPVDPTVLAIPCTGPSGGWHVYLVKIDGTVVREVVSTGQAGRVNDPSFSPDGKLLVLAAGIDLDHDGGNLVVVSGDGQFVVRKLTSTDRPGADSDPAWSPDGTQVAFRRRAGGNTDVWVIRADGSGAHRLTQHKAAEQDPTWSPDGKQIAYKSNVGSERSRTWVMKADGTDQKPLKLRGEDLSAPSWTRR